MSDATELLDELNDGNRPGSEDLLPLVYDELRRLAARRLADERLNHTLSATSLVHEVYLRLANRQWNDQGHFFAVAAEAMRRILVDNARRKGSLKRGGDLVRVDLNDFEATWDSPTDELLSLDEALQALEAAHPRKAALVKLRFFAGLSMEQCAKLLGIARSTAQDDWTYARCWLQLQIDGPDLEPGDSLPL
jgi:RNA polymerase sigma factor (TIGR02999 family)